MNDAIASIHGLRGCLWLGVRRREECLAEHGATGFHDLTDDVDLRDHAVGLLVGVERSLACGGHGRHTYSSSPGDGARAVAGVERSEPIAAPSLRTPRDEMNRGTSRKKTSPAAS